MVLAADDTTCAEPYGHGMLAGVLLAAVASVLFNAAIVLQAAEARTVPGCHGLRISLFARLLRRPRWVAGIALSVVAVGVQILALTQAPLTVVQPADAAGLVLLLVIGSRVLDERVSAREGGAVIGIVVAIVAIVIAQPAGSEMHAGAVGISCALALIGAVAAAPFVLRSRGGSNGMLVVFGAGFAFAAGAFAIKLVADCLAAHAWTGLAVLAAVAVVAGLAGTLSEQTALQRRRATQVAPIIFVTELIVPLVLALVVGGETWGASASAACMVSAGLALLIASVATLMRAPAVSELLSA